MKIKGLWIIADSGLCLYSYGTENNEYKVEDNLISGLIVALSSFAGSLTNKSITYVKLDDDSLYFTKKNRILLASIIEGKVEKSIIDSILDFVGETFLARYDEIIDNPNIYIQDIQSEFSTEVDYLFAEDVYEELKRGIVNTLVTKIVNGKEKPEMLTYKVMELFQTSSPENIDRTISMLKLISKQIKRTAAEDIRQNLEMALQKTIDELTMKMPVLDFTQKKQVLVVCDNDRLFEVIFQKFLSIGLICVQLRTLLDAKSAVSADMQGIMSFNLLIITESLTAEDLTYLDTLTSNPDTSAMICVQDVKNIREKVINKSNVVIFNYCESLNKYYDTCPLLSSVVEYFKK